MGYRMRRSAIGNVIAATLLAAVSTARTVAAWPSDGPPDQGQLIAGPAGLGIYPPRARYPHPRPDPLRRAPPGLHGGRPGDPDGLDAGSRSARILAAHGGELDRQTEVRPPPPAAGAGPLDRRRLAERGRGIGPGGGVGVDRPERRQPHGLHLYQSAARTLDEVGAGVVVGILARARGPHYRRRQPDCQRPTDGRYNDQPRLSARQRRVQRSAGSITILSIATITTSITNPQEIIPVKLPA